MGHRLWHQEHPVGWKRDSGKETKMTWFGFLGKQSRKRRVQRHSFVGAGVTPRSRREGKEHAAGKKYRPVPEGVMELGHKPVAQSWGPSSERLCKGLFLGTVLQKRKGEECVHRLRRSFTPSMLIVWTSWPSLGGRSVSFPDVQGNPKGKRGTSGTRGCCVVRG